MSWRLPNTKLFLAHREKAFSIIYLTCKSANIVGAVGIRWETQHRFQPLEATIHAPLTWPDDYGPGMTGKTRSWTEAKEKRREGAKEEGEGRSEKAKSQGRKKHEWQNRKRKLSKEKTQRNICRRVNLDSSSESDDTLAAVIDVRSCSCRYFWTIKYRWGPKWPKFCSPSMSETAACSFLWGQCQWWERWCFRYYLSV